MNTTSFIIPYQYRYGSDKLFYYYLSQLPLESEICIIETGTQPTLNLTSKYKYLFLFSDSSFNRAHYINVCIRNLATRQKLIISDNDLILTPKWFTEAQNKLTILNDNIVYIGFGKLLNLSQIETAQYLQTLTLPKHTKIERTPAILGAAGGITLITRNLINRINGIPNDFNGFWGGEDNALMLKLQAHNCIIETFESTIYHLYHEKTTPREPEIAKNIMNKIKNWSYKEWELHTKLSADWGIIDSSYNKELL